MSCYFVHWEMVAKSIPLESGWALAIWPTGSSSDFLRFWGCVRCLRIAASAHVFWNMLSGSSESAGRKSDYPESILEKPCGRILVKSPIWTQHFIFLCQDTRCEWSHLQQPDCPWMSLNHPSLYLLEYNNHPAELCPNSCLTKLWNLVKKKKKDLVFKSLQ